MGRKESNQTKSNGYNIMGIDKEKVNHLLIFTKMILSETHFTSYCCSIYLSATNTSTPAVTLLFPEQYSLYLASRL